MSLETIEDALLSWVKGVIPLFDEAFDDLFG